MNRDAFAKQFIEGLAGRGASREEIAKILPQALADFDGGQQGKMTSEQALAKQVPIGPEMNINPLTQMLGKTQEFLGNSPALPIASSAIGGVLGGALGQPNVGAGVGMTLGLRGKNALAEGGPQALIPSKEEAVNEVGAGVATGVAGSLLNKVLNYGKGAIGAKSVVPSRIATATRNTQAIESTAKYSGDEIGQAFTKAASDSPGGVRKKAMEFAIQDVERLKGTKLTTKQLVEEISKQWNASHSSKGTLLTKAQAQYANQARSELMRILQAKAPEIAAQTKKIGKLIGGQEVFAKIMKILVPTAVVGGAVKGLGQ